MRKALISTLLAATALLGVPTAEADDTLCVGTLPPGVYDNVIVPPGQSCIAQGSTINGNVKVLEGGRFLSNANNTIAGSVQGERNARIFLQQDRVGGSVEATGFRGLSLNGMTVGGSVRLGGEAGSAAIDNSRIAGSVLIERAFFVQVLGSAIGNELRADLVITETLATPGDISVQICGTTLPNGNIRVEKSGGTGIRIGGPGCGERGGNEVLNGNLEVVENVINEGGLDIGENTVAQNVEVLKNTGSGTKTVQANVVDDTLRCFKNGPLFVGGPNLAQKTEGQCF